MAADPQDPRTKRRKAMGDDPNKMSVAPQPLPGMPQDSKSGNVMNYPMEDFDGQMGQRIGSGRNQFPYGDLGDAVGAAAGILGFEQNSGQPQYMVPGRGQNSGNLKIKEPGAEQMSMMEPMYDMAAAFGTTMPNGLNNGQPVSYQVTALGPSGQSMDQVMQGAMGVPGSFPPQMEDQTNNTIPPQGTPNAEASVGMSMGRGGGRNKKS